MAAIIINMRFSLGVCLPMMFRAGLSALLLSCLTAPAHAGSQHVLGTVTAIDDKHIEVRTQKGGVVSVKLTKQVLFKDKDNPKSTEPPSVGDRVIIEATKENKILTATVVHFSAVKNTPAVTH
jgi:hypothetical protein